MTGVAECAEGAILGLAVGDALGAPFEFRRRHDVPDPLPAFALRWNGLPAGTWTDDTAMARNLWTSLLAHDGALDLGDLLARHLAWFETSPPDVGNLTRRVLTGYRDGDPHAARTYWETKGPEVSAGNGSVMYCVPLGVVRAYEPERLLEEAPALSALTHWDERCRTACLAVTLAAAGLVRGEPAPGAVQAAVTVVSGRAGGEELEHLVDAVGRDRELDGPDMGFCLFTAAIALQVAVEAAGFEEGVRSVVSLGGDTDTNAAVAGGLLGARDGAGAIPPAWLDRLAERDAIAAEAAGLAMLATRS